MLVILSKIIYLQNKHIHVNNRISYLQLLLSYLQILLSNQEKNQNNNSTTERFTSLNALPVLHLQPYPKAAHVGWNGGVHELQCAALFHDELAGK